MMRSLFAGVQGLRAHQIRMDVIGNNIANVNTTGFKAGRVNFSEAYSQTMSGAAAPGIDRGGINPRQIGLGVNVASIDTLMSDGSMQLTGKNTDMAISGNGFFVLRDGGRFLYTRAGNFDFDRQGYLLNPATGQRVQGWTPTNGAFPTRDVATMGDIKLPVADSLLAQATSMITFGESLNALAPSAIDPAAPAPPAPPTYSTPFKVIDSLGTEHILTMNMYKTANNRWDVEVLDGTTPLALGGPTPAYTTVIGPDPGAHTTGTSIQFNPDGSLMDPDTTDTQPANIVLTVTGYTPGGGANPMNFDLDLNKIIQPAIKAGSGTTVAPSTLRMFEYDGYPTGALTGIAVDAAGVVTGYYSNNQFRQVAQVALANFFNPGGLTKEGGNNWAESANSGLALVGAAGEGGRGLIAPSTLEMSNVDISAEFTNMIVTQRGFQANSRIITTSDELLQEVVNLKR